MKRRYITKKLTFVAYLYMSFLIWVVVILALLPFVSEGSWWHWLVIPVSLAVTSYTVLRHKRLLRQRDQEVAVFAAKHKLKFDPSKAGLLASLGALDDVEGVRDRTVKNAVEGEDWQYYDFSYNLYGKTKRGEYKRATVYYGVMSTTLPRALPNVFFDSHKARRRQFRFHFAHSQRHSLEGDFDAHFATYFPQDYTIDSMSFISPDVMWKLKEAADYDIEIVGDKLFLYGPLYDPETQITDMATKIKAIKKELLDNILTYRDARLPYDKGRKTVAAQGASLKLSSFWKIVGLVAAGLYIVGRIVFEIWLD